MKLLYAEDEPAMAEAVTDILNCHNFMVDAVQDGQEALDYARSGDYDLHWRGFVRICSCKIIILYGYCITCSVNLR